MSSAAAARRAVQSTLRRDLNHARRGQQRSGHSHTRERRRATDGRQSSTRGTVQNVSEWDLYGVPYTSMAQRGGIADAIAVLRSVGLAARAKELGVHDRGDLSVEQPTGNRGRSRVLNEEALRSLVRATKEAVETSIRRSRKALLVGGDCPVILGALAAIRSVKGSTSLVMFDGHEDAWLPARSATGEASDSEVAIAIGTVREDLSDVVGVPLPLLDASRVALLGPRDAEEIRAGAESSLRGTVALFMDDVGVLVAGGGAAGRSALEAVGDVDLWVHVDLDVLTSDSFGAVDYPQAGGIGWRELDAAFAVTVGDTRCRGASVAIYNPDRDSGRDGAASVVDFIARMLGSTNSERTA
jgi:arginase